MKISHVSIRNYRNLEEIDIETNKINILIGDNNSGKSNLLKAITLPFINDEIGTINKNLGWQDINTNSKELYYQFIEEHLEEIQNNTCNVDDFYKVIPVVSVDIRFEPKGSDEYFVRKWKNDLVGDSNSSSIRYEYCVENQNDLYKHITKILSGVDSIEHLRMNLLPIEFYKYYILVPSTGEQVSFTDLNEFQYNSLAAERDEFSNKASRIGSKALVSLLQNKLTEEQKVKVEQSYDTFFNEMKDISKVEDLFNWQEVSELENAKDFFNNITLLPNMPSMSSLLNNVKLGYGDDYLNSQGLGYRNLVYLFVMMNSLEVSSEVALNILTIEEPEAHLSVSNEHLLGSFINSIVGSNDQLQLFVSTHSSEFLNKLQLENVTILANGSAFSLKMVLEEFQLDYLAKKPNLDFLKFLFSRNCILVEGPTDEMIIKSYLSKQTDWLNDIEVISLHKGFIKMIEIWLKVNANSIHRLGIVRDSDEQSAAQMNHEAYNSYDNVFVTTTREYTLEPEIVSTGNNFDILKTYFTNTYGWEDIDTPKKLSDKWRGAKTDTMLKFCRDLETNELDEIELPQHINRILSFLQSGEKE